MNSVVIYASRYGNTRAIAEAIASVLCARGDVQLLPADAVVAIPTEGVDLLIVGGPTEVHRMTVPMVQLFNRMERGALHGLATAAFDTRIHSARWMTGSAALGIARRLGRLGADVIAPEESFFVAGRSNPSTGEAPVLESGELERAKVWATELADTVSVSLAAAAAVR